MDCTAACTSAPLPYPRAASTTRRCLFHGSLPPLPASPCLPTRFALPLACMQVSLGVEADEKAHSAYMLNFGPRATTPTAYTVAQARARVPARLPALLLSLSARCCCCCSAMSGSVASAFVRRPSHRPAPLPVPPRLLRRRSKKQSKATPACHVSCPLRRYAPWHLGLLNPAHAAGSSASHARCSAVLATSALPPQSNRHNLFPVLCPKALAPWPHACTCPCRRLAAARALIRACLARPCHCCRPRPGGAPARLAALPGTQQQQPQALRGRCGRCFVRSGGRGERAAARRVTHVVGWCTVVVVKLGTAGGDEEGRPSRRDWRLG